MMLLTEVALKSWLDRLAKESTLVAPKLVGGVVLYRPVSGSDEVLLEYTRPKMSAKEIVLPSSERIFSIDKHHRDVSLTSPEAEETVVFGIRPCDAHGIAVMDAVFLQREPVDLNYARRREALTLIGLACPEMWENCFCTSVGGAPNAADHVDVLLTAVQDGYAVDCVTAKGEALVETLEMKAVPAEPSQPALNPVEPVADQERWPAYFTNRYWEQLAERCLECRICAYLCPVCRCFDVRDHLIHQGLGYSQHERLRSWDSCTRPNYRLVAGGHNARATKGERLRNRFYCKFHYFPTEYGQIGCVGCGRCTEACPVNIDIVEVLRVVSQTLHTDEMANYPLDAQEGEAA